MQSLIALCVAAALVTLATAQGIYPPDTDDCAGTDANSCLRSVRHNHYVCCGWCNTTRKCARVTACKPTITCDGRFPVYDAACMKPCATKWRVIGIVLSIILSLLLLLFIVACVHKMCFPCRRDAGPNYAEVNA